MAIIADEAERKLKPPAHFVHPSPWPDVILLLICIALLVFQLFVPPLIGLANNGDFGKILGRLHLVTDTHKNLEFFVSKYQHTTIGWNSGIPMSELVLARPAVFLASLFQKGQDFDIRYLAGVHCLMFLLAFYGFLHLLHGFGAATRLLLGGFVILVFTDVAYTAYFNSFFGDTAALLALLLLTVAGLSLSLSERLSWTWWAVFTGSSVLFVTSKPQHTLEGLILALLALALLRKAAKPELPDIARKILAALTMATLVVAGAFEMRAAPSWYKSEATFNIIFLDIPKTFPDHQQELKELNLPQNEEKYFGVNLFTLNRDLVLSIYRRVGYSPLIRFYTHHPGATLRILWGDIVASTFPLRPLPLANYRLEDGYSAFTMTSHFCFWSDLRAGLFRVWPAHILVWYGLVIAAAAGVMKKGRTTSQRSLALVCLSICLLGMVEFAVASLGDGGDTRRHLFLFHALTDITVCIAAVAVTYFLRERSVTIRRICS